MDEWGNWIDRGVAEFRAGRSRDAVDAFQRSAEMNPASVDAHLLVAVSVGQQYIPGASTAENQMRGVQVERALRRALELDQRNWVACILLGHYLACEHRAEEARTMFRRALELEPDNADARFALARIRFDEWVADGKSAAGVSGVINEFEDVVSMDRLHDPAMDYIGVALAKAEMRSYRRHG